MSEEKNVTEEVAKVVSAATLKEAVAKFMALDCNAHKEKKDGFDYLSWVWAWTEALKTDPEADFNPVLDPKNGNDYWSDGRTARVYVDVTILGVTKRMSLAVMDYKNAAIPVDKITSCDVNKSIMRCMVKCLAKFGLGLYIYAGEDLPADCGEDLLKKGKEEERKQAEAGAAAKKTVQEKKPSDKPKAGPKMKAAWKAFQELAEVKSMQETARSNYFKANVKQQTGKENPYELTDEEWDKFMELIDNMNAL